MRTWARRGIEALIRRLLDKYDRYRLLQWLARDQGVSGFVVEGEQGVVEGPVEDFAVLRTYAQKKRWAQPTSTRISAFLKDGGTYLDIGANMGLTTIPVARNRKIDCVAFEPDPAMFALLTSNVARNGDQGNVTLHNLALGDRAGTVTLARSPGNAGDIRLQRSGSPPSDDGTSWATVDVAARPLDELGLKAGKSLAVKIDTQGAEALVIAGGRTLLARAGLLVLEFWPYALAGHVGDVAAIVEFLRQNFARGEIMAGDSEEPGAAEPIAAVADRLIELAKSDRAEPDIYYDVWVSK